MAINDGGMMADDARAKKGMAHFAMLAIPNS
jgi:hypothetical protein